MQLESWKKEWIKNTSMFLLNFNSIIYSISLLNAI